MTLNFQNDFCLTVPAIIEPVVMFTISKWSSSLPNLNTGKARFTGGLVGHVLTIGLTQDPVICLLIGSGLQFHVRINKNKAFCG